MLNYTHEPTRTKIETDTGTLPNGGRNFESINIQTGIVGVNRTTYEENETMPSTEFQDVHICTGGVPDPDRMRVHVRLPYLPGNMPGYVSVNVADYTNVYIPLEMAEAIAEALAAEEVAS